MICSISSYNVNTKFQFEEELTMRNPKYHIYLTPDERRTVINSLIDLRNDLILRGKYTDIIDELLIKLTKAKAKKIKVKEV